MKTSSGLHPLQPENTCSSSDKICRPIQLCGAWGKSESISLLRSTTLSALLSLSLGCFFSTTSWYLSHSLYQHQIDLKTELHQSVSGINLDLIWREGVIQGKHYKSNIPAFTVNIVKVDRLQRDPPHCTDEDCDWLNISWIVHRRSNNVFFLAAFQGCIMKKQGLIWVAVQTNTPFPGLMHLIPHSAVMWVLNRM